MIKDRTNRQALAVSAELTFRSPRVGSAMATIFRPPNSVLRQPSTRSSILHTDSRLPDDGLSGRRAGDGLAS